MSQDSSGFAPSEQPHGVSPQANPIGPAYVLTEDEKRILKECNQESFRYRSGPIAVLSMAATHMLIARGFLTASPRFGSLPKMAFAGICGFMAGKISYMKTCQEKLKNLENSPLGEALRQRQHGQFASRNQSEPGPPDQPAFEPVFQPSVDLPGTPESFQSSSSYSEIPTYDTYQPAPFSSTLSESAPTGVSDHISAQATNLPNEEEEPKRRRIRYEELRSRNRENYEVIMNQKAEAAIKPTAEKVPPKKEAKKNIYGDAWEE
ncbi:OCIA domain-containing protein 1 [Paramormyrops kingsleyae]|uniref:OCIA domain-containing protein 1 n=1 Tax=Paramormyrops kingsleyae TaxID=1676925 RepID=A0A3B3RKD9_9TELE|nr:OCIA domain-containing protein 1 isoform X1 [Paramormyrops kingsleyae]